MMLMFRAKIIDHAAIIPRTNAAVVTTRKHLGAHLVDNVVATVPTGCMTMPAIQNSG
jgi:hypothetical protein